MKIDCLSDLHGFFLITLGGDLLIIGGDLTGTDQQWEYERFYAWLCKQDYAKKVFIAGNHDGSLYQGDFHTSPYCDATYLQDSGTEFNGFKIWGSPWTLTFKGMNPKCKAFTVDKERELFRKWELIPDDTDILITHMPPYGFFDRTYEGIYAGSETLLDKIMDLHLKLHVFGHIHEGGGKSCGVDAYYVNASHVNEWYNPVHNPIRIDL